MKTIFLDLETIGIPRQVNRKFLSPKNNEAYDSARIIQMAWIVVEMNEILQDNIFLIKPDNFKILNTFVHGITQDAAEQNGVDIKLVLQFFLQDLKDVKLIVCHNVDFDISILKNEIFRANLNQDKLEITNTYCTMREATKPGRTWPKLSNLYREFFKEEFPAHDALEDSYACLRCYYKMKVNEDFGNHILLARKELTAS
jgi:DNA polymerase III epsilon subunit-like protein